ncbi:MerR family transcriptional regulator [Rhodocyclus tenuis]|uniref:DNA-binding transcriptional MerR regulator n=1 Tax=Rhodocyclus tenuis TaxID=1066 RepID=A0A840G3S1_RHOTE|nr:MerR family transcriptional regulator [Rhodocyclus tenuis]MBB4246576.1 DNA-binding transcriptional MerR regulator [Rhodocyclus tenuis]
MPDVTNNAISIGELSRLSGLSTHTLRFYEAEGILQPAGRNSGGHRQYHPADVLWLEFVLRLKQTGMPLAEIRQYAALRAQGETTLQARLAMLKLHRERLATRIEELSTCASVLDDKIGIYRKMITESGAPADEAVHATDPQSP